MGDFVECGLWMPSIRSSVWNLRPLDCFRTIAVVVIFQHRLHHQCIVQRSHSFVNQLSTYNNSSLATNSTNPEIIRIKMYSFAALALALALAPLALAKTDLTGCTSSVSGPSLIWYVPGTGELCEFLDCG